jgi:hypothetical protein
MVCNDASACLQSIMTDPRLDKADYLLGPRQSICTRITWTTLVTLIRGYLTKIHGQNSSQTDKQILVPTPLYLDGCVTGQFANLAIAQFKMTIGIIRGPRQGVDFAVIPDVAPDKSRGRRIMLSSRHCDAIMTHQDVGEGSGQQDPVCKLEDYHAMLSVALESLIECSKTPNIGFLR